MNRTSTLIACVAALLTASALTSGPLALLLSLMAVVVAAVALVRSRR